MTVRAELEGHPFDLDALAREFATGDPHIVVTDEGTFLETTALDALFDDPGRLVNTANEHLARLNGYAILADAVRLRSRFVRGGRADPRAPRGLRRGPRPRQPDGRRPDDRRSPRHRIGRRLRRGRRSAGVSAAARRAAPPGPREASLWLDDPATDVGARGVAGGHACRCLLANDGTRPE
jgi:hypothetical protein